ncbi:hypothetical protein FJZ28_03965 [Candidatus Peregrinibacteria bacterium]|nr:hypothetical protein [Candidatus Peregrinibacteria bacterium]
MASNRQSTISEFDAAFHTLGAILAILSILILLVMMLIPFLTIDRDFHVTPVFSLANFYDAWDPVMVEAISNSILLSVIASVFAIACGSLITRMLKRYTTPVAITIILVYVVNPVTRAFSYSDLFTIRTSLQQGISLLIGEWPAQMIVLPAIILGAHYLPIYLLRFLFVIHKRTAAHHLTGLLNILFVSIPAFLRGFPISFALFFLLTFFDYWVIQVISGGKALYWSQMFEQKAFIARDVGQAGMLIIMGLVLTVLAYVGAWLACSALRMLWCKLRPLRIVSIRFNTGFLLDALGILLLCFLAWPPVYSMMRLVQIVQKGSGFTLIDGGMRAIVLTLILASSIAVVSTVLSFICSALYRERPQTCRWWLPSFYFLALVPEAAYVLFSVCVTGLGLLHGSPYWLFFLMTSFSMPISFFLWESLWGEIEDRKLWMLAGSLRGRTLSSIVLGLKEWRAFFALTFIINVWMTVDNVFITNFAAGPKWKPLSAIIFTATKRGFSDQEFLTGFFGSLCILIVVGVSFLFAHRTLQDTN